MIELGYRDELYVESELLDALMPQEYLDRSSNRSHFTTNAGQTAGLVRKARSAGAIDVLTVDLDATAWTRLVTGGLVQNTIHLP